MILEKQVYIPAKPMLPRTLATNLTLKHSEFIKLLQLRLKEFSALYPTNTKIEKIVLRFELSTKEV